MHLDELHGQAVRRHPRGPVDQQDAPGVAVELGALAELARVLHRELVQVEQVADHGQLLGRRRLEVEPEELVACAQGLDPGRVDGGQDLHRPRH
jgi:hypothetical protein